MDQWRSSASDDMWHVWNRSTAEARAQRWQSMRVETVGMERGSCVPPGGKEPITGGAGGRSARPLRRAMGSLELAVGLMSPSHRDPRAAPANHCAKKTCRIPFMPQRVLGTSP